ncbi:MAG: hypothetical protein M9924_20510 [Rhizobiaceae bacterium]|nr:hypothetical protein [Rhizobiaceae bacterium]
MIVLRAAILIEACSDMKMLKHRFLARPLLVAALLWREALAANHSVGLHFVLSRQHPHRLLNYHSSFKQPQSITSWVSSAADQPLQLRSQS